MTPHLNKSIKSMVTVLWSKIRNENKITGRNHHDRNKTNNVKWRRINMKKVSEKALNQSSLNLLATLKIIISGT